MRLTRGRVVRDPVETLALSQLPIRADLLDPCANEWARLGRPGTWWSGRQRVSIAAQARAAESCTLCATRKASLSPYQDARLHDPVDGLPQFAVDAAHRIASDPGRLTERWVTEAART